MAVAVQTRRNMAVSWYAVVLLAATAFGASIAPVQQTLEKSTACGRIWITINSLEKTIEGHKISDPIELNWDFTGCFYRPKQIGLFDSRPTDWTNAMDIFGLDSDEGHIVTNRSFEKSPLPGGWSAGSGQKGPHCLWPWVAAGEEQIVTYNCLRIQPTWMEDNLDKIGSFAIGKLTIPGTHNAGAWRFNTELSTLERDSFVLCQDRSIFDQLVYGIRYFDFRVGYYDFYQNEEDRYWLNHNLIRVRPLVPLLKEISAFMNVTNEVVFLDAHHFPMGFYEQDGSPIRRVHAGLLELVQRELGPHIANARDFNDGASSGGPPLNKFISANKRLLFSYVDNAIVAENNWLWPILPHLWASTNNPNTLLTYLDNAIASSPSPNARSPLYSAMAQTTPTVLDILFLRGSLRQNADNVNRNVTRRLSTVWRQQANIVSSDFFLANDVIDLSIKLSVERSSL